MPRTTVAILAAALTWLIAGLMILNTLGNLSSVHWFERWVLGVVTVLVALVAIRLARNPASGLRLRKSATGDRRILMYDVALHGDPVRSLTVLPRRSMVKATLSSRSMAVVSL